MRESSTRFSYLHIKSLKGGQPYYLHSLRSFPPHRYIPLFSPLVALLSPLVLNCKQIFLSFCSCLVEQYAVWYVTLLIASLLQLTCLWSVNLCFLKKLKTHPFQCSFPPEYVLVCFHLGYPSTDISGIDQASLFHLIFISLSFTLISFMQIFI